MDTQTQMNILPSSSTDLADLAYNLQRLQDQINSLIDSVGQMQEDIDDELEEKQCDICSEFKDNNHFAAFCCIDHKYCDNCINSVLSDAIQSFKVVKCPNDDCKVEFNEESPFFPFLLEEIRDKYLRILSNKKVLSNPNVNLCSVPNCTGFVPFDAQKIECSACKQGYCKKCREYSHEGKCDRLVVRGMEKKYKFRKCPQCKMVVQKNEGCDHMTCLCTHQFCYKCGQSYINGSHGCVRPWYLRGFAAFRWSVQREPTFFENNTFNLSRVLYYLELDQQSPILTRIILTILFIVLLYPLINAVTIGIILLAATLYYGLALVIIILYFIFLPLAEVWKMQLAISRCMKKMNVPTFIIRLLMIPAYPLNFFIGICTQHDGFNISAEKDRVASLLRIISFSLALPCLINTDAH